MAPKFRGDSDDWLDDENARAGHSSAPKKAKAGVAPRATELPPERANAVVTEVFPNQCRVLLDGDHVPLACNYRRAGIIGRPNVNAKERSPVAVGDRVLVHVQNPGSGIVEGMCKRRNQIARKAPGREETPLLHILAANVDLVVIVSSVVKPVFSPEIVDRFLKGAENGGIEPLLCITKTDLMGEAAPHPWLAYREKGIEVREISVRTGLGIEDLKRDLLEKAVHGSPK